MVRRQLRLIAFEVLYFSVLQGNIRALFALLAEVLSFAVLQLRVLLAVVRRFYALEIRAR